MLKKKALKLNCYLFNFHKNKVKNIMTFCKLEFKESFG